MSTDDVRDYINPHPRFSLTVQRAILDSGTSYIEDRSGKVIEKLIDSVRRGTIVRVYRPFLLAPIIGKTPSRRAKWADRVERIKAKGGKVISAHNPKLTNSALAMLAYEEIGTSGRGKAGGRTGRPKKVQDPVLFERCVAIWQSQKYKTREKAAEAIGKLLGKTINRSWCYSNFGKPGLDT